MDVKHNLPSQFDMKYLGVTNFIFEMEIKRDWASWKL